MKRHILFGAALLSLFVASCGNDDDIEKGSEAATGNTVTISTRIQKGETRLSYDDAGADEGMKVEWSGNETFTVYHGLDDSMGETFGNTQDNPSKFTGNIPEGTGTYYAIYGDNVTPQGDALFDVDITAQKGTDGKDGITEFMLAESDQLTSSTTLTFKHLLSVLKLNLTLPAEARGKASNVVVAGLHNSASYMLDFSTFMYNDKNKREIVATNGDEGFEIKDNKILAYVAIFPEYVAARSVTIKVNVGMDEYAYTLKNEKIVESGKVIPVNVTLTKSSGGQNYKATYTNDDYYQWDAYLPYQDGSGDWGPTTSWYNSVGGNEMPASASCKDCPTPQQAVAYLKAGAYWDDSNETEGMRCFKDPTGNEELHVGLWLKKKNLIPDFYTNTLSITRNYPVKMSTLTADEVRNIRTSGDYFFLPAAGDYSGGSHSAAGDGTPQCWYWLRSSYVVNTYERAFYLNCSSDKGYGVYVKGREYGCIPMVTE